jgi:hypothetical protein
MPSLLPRSRGQNVYRHTQMQDRFRIKNETSFSAPRVRPWGEAGKVEVSRLAGSLWVVRPGRIPPGASFSLGRVAAVPIVA